MRNQYSKSTPSSSGNRISEASGFDMLMTVTVCTVDARATLGRTAGDRATLGTRDRTVVGSWCGMKTSAGGGRSGVVAQGDVAEGMVVRDACENQNQE